MDEFDLIEVGNHLDNIGYHAEDVLTDRSGVVTQVCFEYGGKVQYLVEWLSGDNTVSRWYDCNRLEVKE